MMKSLKIMGIINKIGILAIIVFISSCESTAQKGLINKIETKEFTGEKVIKSEKEWKSELSVDEFQILRMAGTERAFTSDLLDNKKNGTYTCAGCQLPLFESDTKFESGTGWPSFYQPVKEENMMYESDSSHGMSRVEVLCPRCEGHLGHVFNDGPRPTGLRYCINGDALDFIEK